MTGRTGITAMHLEKVQVRLNRRKENIIARTPD